MFYIKISAGKKKRKQNTHTFGSKVCTNDSHNPPLTTTNGNLMAKKTGKNTRVDNVFSFKWSKINAKRRFSPSMSGVPHASQDQLRKSATVPSKDVVKMAENIPTNVLHLFLTVDTLCLMCRAEHNERRPLLSQRKA